MYCPMSVGGVVPQAQAVIAGYAPRCLPPVAAGFARSVVALAAPATPARAKALLFAAGRLGAFAEQRGLELSPGVLLDASVVERFVIEGCRSLSPATRRTLRTNLRALGRSLERYPQPAPVALPRERAKPPYSRVQIDGFLRLAAAQSTAARRMRCQALVCLGAGAGVIAGELRHVRGTDVAARSGGVLVAVAGRRARTVPVLHHYHELLLEAAGFAGERLIVGGRGSARLNITGELSRRLSRDSSLARLEPGRLRSTWLLACAQQIGLGAFMQAAGVASSQRLGDLAAALPKATEAQLVTLLGAPP